MLTEHPASYKQLLYLAGESSFRTLPENIALETEMNVTGPSQAHLREAMCGSGEMDDLNGRPFQYLHAIRAPIDLPVRLSPKQKQVLHAPPPLILQEVAGSGKKTLLTHLAHRELVRMRRDDACVLMVAYTEHLKAFIERLFQTLDDGDQAQHSEINVLSWRELCDWLAARIGIKPFQWTAPNHFALFLESWILSHPSQQNCAKLIPELGEFIRASVKGNNEESGRFLIDQATFMKMPATALDQYIDRATVYEIAEHYQYVLHQQRLSDDLDAARTGGLDPGFNGDVRHPDRLLETSSQRTGRHQCRELHLDAAGAK